MLRSSLDLLSASRICSLIHSAAVSAGLLQHCYRQTRALSAARVCFGFDVTSSSTVGVMFLQAFPARRGSITGPHCSLLSLTLSRATRPDLFITNAHSHSHPLAHECGSQRTPTLSHTHTQAHTRKQR